MDIAITRATADDETTFRHLYQFYMYEFSRFTGWPTNSGGLFPQHDLDGCWTDQSIHPFLLRVDGKLGGLAIVFEPDISDFSNEKEVIQIGEFFVMGSLMGKGIGEQFATYLFDLFPGKWEVFEMIQNVNAQAFWRKVIGRYTNGQFREAPHEQRGVVQYFDNSARAGR